MSTSQYKDTRFLLLTVSPVGDDWYNDPKHASEFGAKPSPNDPMIIRANGDITVIYADRDDIPEDTDVEVAEGVTAKRVTGLPTLNRGDQWRDDNRASCYPCTYPIRQITDEEKEKAEEAATPPKMSKKITPQGQGVLDYFMSKSKVFFGKKPFDCRAVAMLVYNLGRYAGTGNIPFASAHAAIKEVLPDSVILSRELAAHTGAPDGTVIEGDASFRGTWDDLSGILSDGFNHPKDALSINPTPAAFTNGKHKWNRGDDAELGFDLACKLAGPGLNPKISQGEPLRAVYDRAHIRICGKDNVWMEAASSDIEKLAARYAGTFVAAPTEKNPEACYPVSLSYSRIKGIVSVAEMHLSKTGFFDQAPNGIAIRGDKDTPQFLAIEVNRTGRPIGISDPVPLSPEHRVREGNVIPVSYDPDAKCPMFADFLDDLFPGVSEDERMGRQTAILQFMGAALLGLGTTYQRALLLTGEGANGKSTLLEIITALFPRETTISLPMHVMQEDYKAAMLANARVNICNELPAREILDGDKIKGIISGEMTNARSPHEKPFTFHPRTTHLFACNRLPPTKDLSFGFFRRFIPIEFPACFEGREDRGVASRIIENELSGIFTLAIQGARLLIEQGEYTRPESVSELAKAWQRNSDSVSLWLHERTERAGWTKGESAYVAYKIWCERVGMKNVSLKEFSLRMTSQRIDRKTPGNVVHWGITVIPDPSAFSHDPVTFDN